MPWGLQRYYGTRALHFITWSCYGRQSLLGTPEKRDLLLTVLEKMRLSYYFVVVGYVVMPEHVHLLMSEPEIGTPSVVMQAVKLGFARKVIDAPDENPHFSRPNRARNGAPKEQRHIWLRRFYDFNVWSESKESEKLRYMHNNPVARGLVQRPEDWRWSSFLSYATGAPGIVRINDWSRWEHRIKNKLP